MTEPIDLKTLEKKVIRTYYEGGAFEIIFGSMFFGMSFGPYFRENLPEPWRYFLWPLLVIGIVILLSTIIKNFITKPRMGIVKLLAKKKSTKRKLLIFIIINTIILVICLFLTISGIFFAIPIKGYLIGLIIGLLFITLPLSIIGYLIQSARMYIVGFLGGITIFLVEFLIPFIGIFLAYIFSYGLIGIILLFIGILVLIRFIKNYPLPK